MNILKQHLYSEEDFGFDIKGQGFSIEEDYDLEITSEEDYGV